eukprot:3348644-Pleurochrysis_carterae.AAC.1
MDESSCCICESGEKLQTGSSRKLSAQPGRRALPIVETSQGRNAREWTTTLSLGKAKAWSSRSGT